MSAALRKLCSVFKAPYSW